MVGMGVKASIRRGGFHDFLRFRSSGAQGDPPTRRRWCLEAKRGSTGEALLKMRRENAPQSISARAVPGYLFERSLSKQGGEDLPSPSVFGFDSMQRSRWSSTIGISSVVDGYRRQGSDKGSICDFNPRASFSGRENHRIPRSDSKEDAPLRGSAPLVVIVEGDFVVPRTQLGPWRGGGRRFEPSPDLVFGEGRGAFFGSRAFRSMASRRPVYRGGFG